MRARGFGVRLQLQHKHLSAKQIVIFSPRLACAKMLLLVPFFSRRRFRRLVRPIMEKRHGYLLANGGALPRVEAARQDDTADNQMKAAEHDDGSLIRPQPKLGNFSIPALADLGVHTKPTTPAEPAAEVVHLRQSPASDVYDLFRRTSPSAPVQHGWTSSVLSRLRLLNRQIRARFLSVAPSSTAGK